MAAENLIVLHENISTAYFDTKDRILHCPTWKDMSSELYDLVMGHEIGHALNTPPEGWHNALLKCNLKHDHDDICYDANFKLFLNVCEDARIEKKIKRKFPGLKKSFATAYESLYEKDFFGIKKLKDLNELNLIDRINTFFKLGSFLPVKFDHEEQDIIRRLEDAESFEEIVKIAREIYKIVQEEQNKINSSEDLQDSIDGKKKQQDQQSSNSKQQKSQQKQSDKSSDNDSEGKDSKKTSGKKEDQKSFDANNDQKSDSSEGDQQTKSSGSEQSDEDGEDSHDGDSDENGEESEENPTDKESDRKADAQYGGTNFKNKVSEKVKPVCITDKIFREREQSLVSQDKRDVIANCTLPTPNLDQIIYSPKTVVEYYEKSISLEFSGQAVKTPYDVMSAQLITHYQNKNKNFISMLLKEFEMRKNATQYYRAQTHRSGELETRRLSQYRWTSDIFRRITEMPKGKSHGMILFLDMSGSMDGQYMACALEQILILVTFCNKAKIPYDVYGFADTLSYNSNQLRSSRSRSSGLFSSNPRDLLIYGSTNFHLRHLISSRDNSGLQKRCMRMLAMHTAIMERRTKEDSYNRTPDVDTNIIRILGHYKMGTHHGLGLSGTPLIETIVASRKIIDEFKNIAKVDIVNVIHLTDGAGGNNVQIQHNSIPGYSQAYGNQPPKRMILTDPLTRKFVLIDGIQNMQASLTSFVKEVTECRHIGYYICPLAQVRQQSGYNRTSRVKERDKGIVNAHEETIEKFGFYKTPTLGYDNYYFISSESMNMSKISTNKDSDGSSDKILKGFLNSQNAKKAARVVLSQFAEEIALSDSDYKNKNKKRK